MNKKRLLYILLAGFIGISGLLTLYWNDSKGNTLVVGTNAEYPPYAFIKNREIDGFDIDVAKEVAKRLNKKVEFRDMPFEDLLTQLILKKVDFVAAGMSKTETRAQHVLFARPHHENDPLMIVSLRNKPINHMKELNGKKLIVNDGYSHEQAVSHLEPIEIVRLPSPADAFEALIFRKADAFITPQTVVNSHRKVIDGIHSVRMDKFQTERVSLVVPKGEVALLSQIESALNAMKKDGTLDQIKGKWDLQR